MSSTSESPFPPTRRIVTGHTPQGKSLVLDDSLTAPRFLSPESKVSLADLHYTAEAPAVIDTELTTGKWIDEAKTQTEKIFSGKGSNFRSIDFAPGTVSPLHRTVTLDYGIVFRGTITLELEEGERITLREGDTVVQRGTMHTWRNETDEWTKLYFVMLDAKPIEVQGKTLGEEFHEAK
ncbi:hypothetical protein FB45DRAFT_914912 [Roridomyces roridus]|uniref:Cupin type-2 domain-containing protein n=1 Tax=Roridomyces roridus TaxID=1738132 RepID=A0AAD7BT07_9AGAR|nr:hypothetical protein FB45DRAFT_914912 [Roridomyces roridus]